MQWVWRRLAAVAPIGPLAWEPPYDTGVALKKNKRQKKRKKKQYKMKYIKTNKKKKKKQVPKRNVV